MTTLFNDFGHHRRSTRLPEYDYSQNGPYFVTFVAHERKCLFGEVADGAVVLSGLGHVVQEEWLASASVREEIELDEFIVMPNHLHGIVVIRSVGASGGSPLQRTRTSRHEYDHPHGPHPCSLGSFVAGFKSASGRRINKLRGTPGLALWQRGYHDHIIRNEDDLYHTRRYILENPLRWADDDENPRKR